MAADAGPLLQGTAAATAAWIIAKHVIKHHEPFFAPISAVIALNAPLGERGSQAMRLLLGVFVGIGVGELATAALARADVSLMLATLVATAIARALGGARIVIAQAAASAILTVAVADEQLGPHRLVDALIGAGVALAFSQFLFSPEPVTFLRRAETAALTGMAQGLELTAQAIERHDVGLLERAMDGLRDRLSELGRVRVASASTARHSLIWRPRMKPLVGENESAGHLDLLGGSCLMLTRIAMATDPPERSKLAPSVRELSSVLAGLAEGPGDRANRQRAADRALALAHALIGIPTPPDSTLTAAITAVRIVAGDIMVFAGIAPGHAFSAMRRGIGVDPLEKS